MGLQGFADNAIVRTASVLSPNALSALHPLPHGRVVPPQQGDRGVAGPDAQNEIVSGAADTVVRHQDPIVTLFELFSLSDEGILPTATLVGLLGDLGQDSAAVRSALHRMKTSGILLPSRTDGTAGYQLNGFRKIAHLQAQRAALTAGLLHPETEWILAHFSIPEDQRRRRHQIRRVLGSMGFGTVAPGIWIATLDVLEYAQEVLRQGRLSPFVEFFRGHFVNSAEVKGRVAEWWDLEAMESQFHEFLTRFGDPEAVHKLVADTSGDLNAKRGAFRHLVAMEAAWRHLPIQGPLLPLSEMPETWSAPAVRQTVVSTREALIPLCEVYVDHVRSLPRRRLQNLATSNGGNVLSMQSSTQPT